MRGTQVTCLEQLSFAARHRIAVTGKSRIFIYRKKGGPCLPAGFVLNMHGDVILGMIRQGLWFYVPEKIAKTERKKK